MRCVVHADRKYLIGKRDPMLYGGFLEHFHRQIYGGVYDPEHETADEMGFRQDVLEALKPLQLPVLRWPGGCFVSTYHWQDGVGKEREAVFDKTWRVEEPNTFGTDEFFAFCRKLGCEPYICSNAGTGTPEEMSDWLEYCNLKSEGRFAQMRIRNGHPEPYRLKYFSVGNENWSRWELGAKTTAEWGRLVEESAKLLKHVDPEVELSAAALADPGWNLNLLTQAGDFLDWISIHQYWDPLWQVNDSANYDQVMAYTVHTEDSIRKTKGILCAMGLEKRIKIAFDEWNLRGWHHPNIHCVKQGRTPEEYLLPRDENDDNACYTMADAVFSACFLNTLNRNCDIVKMANYAPIVNTRGYICTGQEGIVLRSVYFVFLLYRRYLGDIVLNAWFENVPEQCVRSKEGTEERIPLLDILATAFTDRQGAAVAAVNKAKETSIDFTLDLRLEEEQEYQVSCHYIDAPSPDSYNDFGHTEISVKQEALGRYTAGMQLTARPHTVSIFVIE